MIELNKTDYKKVIEVISNDNFLDDNVKEYVKNMFFKKEKVRKITWAIAQERLNKIPGRENCVITRWNGTNGEATIIMDCKHVVTYNKGSFILSTKNKYGGWGGQCPKCLQVKTFNILEKSYKEEYDREIEYVKELVDSAINESKNCFDNKLLAMDSKLEMLNILYKLCYNKESK